MSRPGGWRLSDAIESTLNELGAPIGMGLAESQELVAEALENTVRFLEACEGQSKGPVFPERLIALHVLEEYLALLPVPPAIQSRPGDLPSGSAAALETTDTEEQELLLQSLRNSARFLRALDAQPEAPEDARRALCVQFLLTQHAFAESQRR